MIATRYMAMEDPLAIPQALSVLQDGGLIAFPTDTIYGLAADPFNPAAIQRIFAVKGRPEEKALPVLIGSIDQLDPFVAAIDDAVSRIASRFWPGPLTIVMKKNAGLPDDLSPYPTIGIRMPDHAPLRTLLQTTGPLATTSANLSGGRNALSAADVREQLGGRIELVLDGGISPGSAASTVVDMTTPQLSVLRPGPISLAQLMAALKED